MVKDICFKGRFSLRYKCYVGDHQYTTHDIEIVKWNDKDFIDSEGKNCGKTCYTIAWWNDDEDSDLVSCGNRLLEAIETIEDLDDIKCLVEIGENILNTEKKVLKDY